VLDGTLIRTGAEYQHYCAQRIAQLLPDGAAAVAEIGGGFGGMAYYLVRDRPGTTYIDFDVPESIALTSYYLLKAFPKLKIVLYGEAALTAETIGHADIVLMPNFEIAALPAKAVDLTFSSHAISDVSPAWVREYLDDITRTTRKHFLCIGDKRAMTSVSLSTRESSRETLTLLETHSSDWDRHLAPMTENIECLYLVHPSSVLQTTRNTKK
jgi:hypothetical protein